VTPDPRYPRKSALALLLALGLAVGGTLLWLALRGEDRGDTSGRDIVYVVLDRYGGPVTLAERFGFDNGAFLDSLEDRGFYVADASLCPYQKTAHSLAASLNMTYLDDLLDPRSLDPADWGPVYGLIRDFRVARFLQDRGYEYAHVGSWWDPTAQNPAADVNVAFGTEFYADRRGIYRATPDQFDAVVESARRPGPTFVFAHINLPHPPYVFDRRGGYVSVDREVSRGRDRSYVEQVRYTNVLVGRMVDRLLAVPEERRPVVVLQADEGPHPLAYEFDPLFDWWEATDAELREKFFILNAYFLPGVDAELSAGVSPVNTFRIIFREYFRADLPLLPDRSFTFRDEQHLYRYREVTDRIRSGAP
jgi:Sulfatase